MECIVTAFQILSGQGNHNNSILTSHLANFSVTKIITSLPSLCVCVCILYVCTTKYRNIYILQYVAINR